MVDSIKYFNTATEIIKNTLYECKKCGEIIRLDYKPKQEQINKYVLTHLKTCNCEHTFGDWMEMNLGTWPDIEMDTYRRCSKCKYVERL